MAKKIYRCEPCNYEYERLYFAGVADRHQAPIPPCPVCGEGLKSEEPPVGLEEYLYWCSKRDGGCGAEITQVLPAGTYPKTTTCPHCGIEAKRGIAPGSGFTIIHGKSMSTKGASLDVTIGRNAEERWNKVIERTEERNKIRKETGTSALHLSAGSNNYEPIKGGHLKSVTVPESKANLGEKI